jgi:hypothetical protein
MQSGEPLAQSNLGPNLRSKVRTIVSCMVAVGALSTTFASSDHFDGSRVEAAGVDCIDPPIKIPTAQVINTPASPYPYAQAKRLRQAVATVIPAGQSDSVLELKSLPGVDPISSSVNNCLEGETVSVTANGRECSGKLIANRTSVLTAGHCGWLKTELVRSFDASGNPIVTMPDMPRVYIGNTRAPRREVALSHEVILPNSDQNDSAILVFDGHTPVEAQALTPELPNFAPGQTAYLSGYPEVQPLNTGALERQQWPVTYLGTTDINIKDGRQLSGVLAFAIKPSADGAICSFGTSGAGVSDANNRTAGDLVAFTDYVPAYYSNSENTNAQEAAANRANDERLFGFNLSEYAGSCYFSPIAKDTTAYKIVTPDYSS